MKFLILLYSTIFSLSSNAFEMKIISVDSYSKPWLVIYESEAILKDPALRGHIHFHGFTQDPKTGIPFEPKYDFPWGDASKIPSEEQLRHFVTAFGFEKEVQLYPHHVVLIPISRGHCDQYPELYGAKKFDETLSKVLAKAEIHEDHFSLSMASAHSGGGEVLSRLISSSQYFLKVARVDFYDALYSSVSTSRVKNWISSSTNRELRLFSISKQEPARQGEKIFKSFSDTSKTIYKMVNEVKVMEKSKKLSSDSILVIIQDSNNKLNHWSLVKALWLY